MCTKRVGKNVCPSTGHRLASELRLGARLSHPTAGPFKFHRDVIVVLNVDPVGRDGAAGMGGRSVAVGPAASTAELIGLDCQRPLLGVLRV